MEEYRVIVEREELTGRKVSVRYEDASGRLHRTHGEPAFELFDPSNGRVLERIYAENGDEHRIGAAPAYQVFDPISGRLTFERWAESGLPPENGVSSIERDVEGNVTRIVRRQSGKQYIEDLEPNTRLGPTFDRS